MLVDQVFSFVFPVEGRNSSLALHTCHWETTRGFDMGACVTSLRICGIAITQALRSSQQIQPKFFSSFQTLHLPSLESASSRSPGSYVNDTKGLIQGKLPTFSLLVLLLLLHPPSWTLYMHLPFFFKCIFQETNNFLSPLLGEYLINDQFSFSCLCSICSDNFDDFTWSYQELKMV